MADDTEPGPDGITPANDNRGAGGDAASERQRRIDRAVLTIARLIGRRIAREEFEALRAANDNRPGAVEDAEDRADEE
ncbi:MAG: hypothetical protein GEU95_27130 [Rhizobiales bacterium]|nr:hypothetical protein [Hyphomicrobiales bacterium]